MQGLYKPDSGRILIDATDMAHVSPHSLRRQMGVVPQDAQLFTGTVRENILIGNPGLDLERVVAVSKLVGAHDFIQRLPKGYDTPLGERGGGLSAGQRQLLCIARALIRNPPVLIFDEPTSALDATSEAWLLRHLQRLAENRTTIIITHRPGPLAIADKVIILVSGEIRQIGTPDQLRRAPRAIANADRQPRPPTVEPESEPPSPVIEEPYVGERVG